MKKLLLISLTSLSVLLATTSGFANRGANTQTRLIPGVIHIMNTAGERCRGAGNVINISHARANPFNFASHCGMSNNAASSIAVPKKRHNIRVTGIVSEWDFGRSKRVWNTCKYQLTFNGRHLVVPNQGTAFINYANNRCSISNRTATGGVRIRANR